MRLQLLAYSFRLPYSYITLAVCCVSCQVAAEEQPTRLAASPGTLIRPPSGPQTGAQTPGDSAARRFLEDPDSESFDFGAIPAGRQRSEKERREMEFRARSTDAELTEAEGGLGSQNEIELGRIEKEFGLEPVDTRGPVPSFSLGTAAIKRLFKKRRFEAALIQTNHMLEFYPRSAQLLMMKGTLHQQLGQLDLALAAYQEAFDFQPSPQLKAQIKYLQAKQAEREKMRNQEKVEGIVIPGGAESVETTYPGFEHGTKESPGTGAADD